jgi:uncharacterized membrane protein
MKLNSFNYRRRERGAIALEAALLIPVFMLVLLVGAMLSDYFLAQQRLHRATAAFADVLANQPLENGEDLFERMRLDQESSFALFDQMALAPGREHDAAGRRIRVSYLDTTLLDDGDLGQTATDSLDCDTGAEDFVAAAQKLMTKSNVARSELVRVEVCLQYQPLIPLSQWVLPNTLSSHFVAQRRYWREG